MAVDLRLLGKLLALTRSDQPQESLRAEEAFTTLFFKWCDEQGLRDDVGFARVGDTSDVGKLFLEAIASPTSARVLQLNTFDLCVVGTLPECQVLAWWFEHALPEIISTSRKSAYSEQDAFQAGACYGARDEIAAKSAVAAVSKAVSDAAVASLRPAPGPAEQPAAVAEAPSAQEVKIPTPKEQTAMRAGYSFGRKLVQRTAGKCPYKLS